MKIYNHKYKNININISIKIKIKINLNKYINKIVEGKKKTTNIQAIMNLFIFWKY